MPHPLPDDVFGVVGNRWFLVAVPDDPAYLRAAYAIYSDMANYWKWGLEGPVPVESDLAAQQWHAAIAETIGLIEMGFPETLLSYIDDVENLLRAMQRVACCYGQDVTNGEIHTEPVVDGVGSVPSEIVDAGFVTDSSDWAGFADYKCMVAHVVVDGAIRKLNLLAPLVDETAETIPAGVGAIVAVLGGLFALASGGWVALVAGLVASVGAAAEIWNFLIELGGPAFTSMAGDIEAARDDIVCDMMGSDGPAAMESALYAAVSEHVGLVAGSVVSFLNMGPNIRALYGGRYDTQNVAQALADQGFATSGYACDCTDVIASDGAMWAFTAATGSNTGSIRVSHVRATTPDDVDIWVPGNGDGAMTVAVHEDAGPFVLIEADREQEINLLIGNPLRVRFRSTSASLRNAGWAMSLLRVYDGTQWVDTTGIEVISSTGSGISYSIDGNTITVPTQDILPGSQVTIEFQGRGVS